MGNEQGNNGDRWYKWFWTTIPGILTAILTPVCGCVGIVLVAFIGLGPDGIKGLLGLSTATPVVVAPIVTHTPTQLPSAILFTNTPTSTPTVILELPSPTPALEPPSPTPETLTSTPIPPSPTPETLTSTPIPPPPTPNPPTSTPTPSPNTPTFTPEPPTPTNTLTPTPTPTDTPIPSPTVVSNLSVNLLNEPGFESGWEETQRGWRTNYWTSYGSDGKDYVSYLYPESDRAHVLAGNYSVRIEGPGKNETAFLSHAVFCVRPDSELLLKFYYKTQGDVSIKAIIQEIHEITHDWSIPQAEEDFVLFEKEPFMTKANEIWLSIRVTGIGQVWIDEIELLDDGRNHPITLPPCN